MACVAAGGIGWISPVTYAQLAFDSADDTVYANGWQEGDDGGSGSFGPWSFDGTYSSPVQQRMDDGLKTGGATSSDFNNLGKSWALYNPAAGDFARAGRSIGALQPGQTVRIVIDNPTSRQLFRGYSVKFNTGGGNLCAAGPCTPGTNPTLKYKIERLENFNNGQWTDTNGSLSLIDSDTDFGTRIDFKLLTTTTYETKMTPLDNPATAVTTSGSLANAGVSGPINWVEFQFFNTQSSVGMDTDFYIKSMAILAAPAVPGDYNANGAVDAADYVVWRKRLGTSFQLSNEVAGVTPGMVTQEDYAQWRARFGRTSGSGAGTSIGVLVPEPSTFAYVVACMLWFCSVRMKALGAFGYHSKRETGRG
jgi:hypothetical protein